MSWPVVKLGGLVSHVSSGATPKGGSENYSNSGPVMFLRSQNIHMNELRLDDVIYINEDTHKKMKRSVVQHGDVLLNITGASIGRVAPFELKGVEVNSNQHVCTIRPMPEVLDYKYLSYFLGNSKFQEGIFSSQRGGTREALNYSQIRDFEIPLPPFEEQKRIAAILDKADAIRRKRQQAIELADDFLRSVFLEMFGDPVSNPKGWEVRSVGEFADCIVPGRDKPKSFTGSTPWVTTNDLNHLGFTLCSKSNIGLSEEEIKHVRARVVPKNSVLMTCVGDLGVVSISANDMVINQQLHAFLTSEKYTSAYLAYALSFQKGYMTSMASSTTLPYMNKTICNGVPVAIAPLSLQLKFESIFMRVNEFKNKLQGQEINPLFNSLSQNAFSGELQL